MIVFPSGCSEERIKPNVATSSPPMGRHRTFQLKPIFFGEHQTLTHEVPVLNDTTRTVKFTRIANSCSCTGNARLAQMVLEPGETTNLHFDIDLRQRKGSQRFVWHLIEDNGASWDYTIETTIHERARFSELGPVHFGLVEPNSSQDRVLDFLLSSEGNPSLSGNVIFRSSSNCLRIEAGDPHLETTSDGIVVRRVPLTIRLTAPLKPGLETATISADVPGQVAKETIHTSATWHVRSRYQIDPPQLYFGTLHPSTSTPVARSVRIRRLDGQPLTIRQVKTASRSLTWRIAKGEHISEQMLVLVLDARMLRQALWEEVSVETDNAAQPLLQIPLGALIENARQDNPYPSP